MSKKLPSSKPRIRLNRRKLALMVQRLEKAGIVGAKQGIVVVSLLAWGKLLEVTPVDFGFLRGGWLKIGDDIKSQQAGVSFNLAVPSSPRSNTTDSRAKTPSERARAAEGVKRSKYRLKPGRKGWNAALVNRVPYAVFINAGRGVNSKGHMSGSPQAPQGMTAPVIDWLESSQQPPAAMKKAVAAGIRKRLGGRR